MKDAKPALETCARLVNAALIEGAQAGASANVLDSLLDSLRALSCERGEAGGDAEARGFE